MANRFWVLGTGPWDSTTTTNWSATSGGAGGASAPTNVDDVFFDSASAAAGYTVTLGAGATCRDVTFAAPATGNVTLAGTIANWLVFGSFTLYAGFIRTGTWQLNLRATSGARTITTAGVSLFATVIFAVGGTYTLQDNFTDSNALTLQGGTLDTNGKAVTVLSFALTNPAVRVLTLGSSVVTINGSSGAFDWGTGASGTLNVGTSSLALTGGGTIHVNLGTVNNVGALNNVTVTASGATQLVVRGVSPVFANLTFTGGASGTANVFFQGGVTHTITGLLTISGNNNTTFRAFVGTASVLGAIAKGNPATISVATAPAITNADIQDITGTGAGSWNLSAISGLSGNCGGNTGITFTTPITVFWQHGASASYAWNDATRWFLATNGGGGAGRVPLPQDTARFDANSFAAGSKTVTQNMARIGAVDWTGVTNNPTWATSTAASFFGSITLSASMTLNPDAQTYTYEGRGSSVLITAGKAPTKAIQLSCANGGGTLTLGDALIFGGGGNLNVDTGTFNDAGFNLTSLTLIVNLGASVILSGTTRLTLGGGAPLQVAAGANVTSTGTLRLTGALTGNADIRINTKTWNSIIIETTGAFENQLSGGGTIGTLNVNASLAARTVRFTAGTTMTIGAFTRDAGTNVITIGSLTAASHTLAKSGGGQIVLHDMSISRSTATPGSTWVAFNSTDGGNNVGWNFAFTRATTAVSASWTTKTAARVPGPVARATAATAASWVTKTAARTPGVVHRASTAVSAAWAPPQLAGSHSTFRAATTHAVASWVTKTATIHSTFHGLTNPATAGWFTPTANRFPGIVGRAAQAVGAAWAVPPAGGDTYSTTTPVSVDPDGVTTVSIDPSGTITVSLIPSDVIPVSVN